MAARIRELDPTIRYPAMIAAARGDARTAVAELRRVLDAGGQYYSGTNLFLHFTPELAAIRDDPEWRAIMSPRN